MRPHDGGAREGKLYTGGIGQEARHDMAGLDSQDREAGKRYCDMTGPNHLPD